MKTQLSCLTPVLVSTLFVTLFAGHSCFAQSPSELPDTHAGKRLAQIIEVVNKNDEQASLKFYTTAFENHDETDVAKRVKNTQMVRSQLGKLTVKKIITSTDSLIAAICGSSNGPDVLMTVGINAEPDYLISSIAVELGYDGDETDMSKPLTSEQRDETIEALAEALRSSYVFPEVGEKMATAVETSLAEGKYEDFSEHRSFCRHLTDQLRDICSDKHLGIRVRRPRGADGGRHRPGPVNHGFVKAEYLPGGIGYLKFNFFSGDPEAEVTAAAAMNFLADSKALIFDLRENGGGSPEMIAFLTSYLFEKKTHLNSFFNRPSGETTESWTREDVPGPRPKAGIPVFVLTSNYTFSGAEEFSYNLKNLERATIVGEVTGGGAHPVMGISLKNGIEIGMPFARAINPITKTNWEGTGVKPDVETSSSAALEKAIELAQSAISADPVDQQDQ